MSNPAQRCLLPEYHDGDHIPTPYEDIPNHCWHEFDCGHDHDYEDDCWHETASCQLLKSHDGDHEPTLDGDRLRLCWNNFGEGWQSFEAIHGHHKGDQNE